MTRREIQWKTVVRKTEKTEMTENGRVFALMHMLHLCLDNNNNLSEQKQYKNNSTKTWHWWQPIPALLAEAQINWTHTYNTSVLARQRHGRMSDESSKNKVWTQTRNLGTKHNTVHTHTTHPFHQQFTSVCQTSCYLHCVCAWVTTSSWSSTDS